MTFIKKMFTIVMFFTAITVQVDSFARAMATKTPYTKAFNTTRQAALGVPVVVEPSVDVDTVAISERQKIEQAIIDTEKIKTAATLAINQAQDQLSRDEISYIEAARIIGEHNYKIEQAKKQLAQLTGKAVEKVEEAEVQESYLSQLMSGAQSRRADLLEKIGYSSTSQEKAIAQAIIDELNSQLEILEKEYAKKIEAATDSQDKMKLSQERDALKRDIQTEIYRQQTITEEVMSTNKKLFWTAVGLAGTAIGGALAYQHLGTELPGETITESSTLEVAPITTGTPLVDPLSTIEQKSLTNEPVGSLLTGEKVRDLLITPEEQELGLTDDSDLSEFTQQGREFIKSGVEGIQSFAEQYGQLSTNALENSDDFNQDITPLSLPEETKERLSQMPSLTGEQVRDLLITPEEQELGLTDDSDLSEFTQHGRESIKSGVERAQALAEQYGASTAQALENADEFNQDITMPQALIEEIKERISQIPGETEEQYLSRIQSNQNQRSFGELRSPQPPAMISEQKQAERVSGISKEFSDAGQTAQDTAQEVGQAIVGANLVASDDLQSLQLSPEASAEYQENIIEPAGRAIANVLGESAAVREDDEEKLLPMDLGTGGEFAE